MTGRGGVDCMGSFAHGAAGWRVGGGGCRGWGGTWLAGCGLSRGGCWCGRCCWAVDVPDFLNHAVGPQSLGPQLPPPPVVPPAACSPRFPDFPSRHGSVGALGGSDRTKLLQVVAASRRGCQLGNVQQGAATCCEVQNATKCCKVPRLDAHVSYKHLTLSEILSLAIWVGSVIRRK